MALRVHGQVIVDGTTVGDTFVAGERLGGSHARLGTARGTAVAPSSVRRPEVTMTRAQQLLIACYRLLTLLRERGIELEPEVLRVYYARWERWSNEAQAREGQR